MANHGRGRGLQFPSTQTGWPSLASRMVGLNTGIGGAQEPREGSPQLEQQQLPPATTVEPGPPTQFPSTSAAGAGLGQARGLGRGRGRGQLAAAEALQLDRPAQEGPYLTSEPARLLSWSSDLSFEAGTSSVSLGLLNTTLTNEMNESRSQSRLRLAEPVSGTTPARRSDNFSPELHKTPSGPPPRQPLRSPSPETHPPPQLMHSERTEPPRPTPKGTKGCAVRLKSNFLRIAITPGRGVFEYHVTFEPQLDSSLRRKQILRSISQIPNRHTFDGAKLCLPDPLPREEMAFIADDSSLGQIRVQVKFVRRQDIKTAVHFYNVLLRRVLEMTGLLDIYRKHYDSSAVGVIPLPEAYKLEVWRGYDTAADRYEGGLMVCVESCHRVLDMTTVLGLMRAIKASTRGAADWKQRFKEAVVGRSILTRYNNAFYRVDDVDFNSDPKKAFTLKSGEEISFVNYYLSQYRQNISDLQQPLLVSKVKSTKEHTEGFGPPRLLVPELCYLTGLTDQMRANYGIMKELIQRTRLTPLQRLQHVRQFTERLDNCSEAVRLLGEWGLTVEPAPVEVDGRVVEPPRIRFNERHTLARLAPSDNDFTKLATSKWFRPVDLERWVVLASGADERAAKEFIDCYRQVARVLGIQYTLPELRILPVSPNGNRSTVTANELRKCVRGLRLDELQFVVLIMSQPNDESYGAFKRELIISNAVPSQVILARTVTANQQKGIFRSIVQKIALQINCKLGGAGWALELPSELKDARVMFVGVDVYHDPTRREKSVLALVATMDNECTRYHGKVSFQTPHQELGTSVGTLFSQALKEYIRNNNATLPSRIVVFRDGIGDGQHNYVRGVEIPQFKAAMRKVDMPKGTRFTFVITQKRINERLFNMNCPGSQNPAPGTIVDETITRRGEYDFFLVSQSVRHGTVTPTHYYVLEDGGENAPDLIQRLTFALTFMYFNWPGSVRVPAVCQASRIRSQANNFKYAHKLAYLVGQYLKEPPKEANESKLFYL